MCKKLYNIKGDDIDPIGNIDVVVHQIIIQNLVMMMNDARYYIQVYQ